MKQEHRKRASVLDGSQQEFCFPAVFSRGPQNNLQDISSLFCRFPAFFSFFEIRPVKECRFFFFFLMGKLFHKTLLHSDHQHMFKCAVLVIHSAAKNGAHCRQCMESKQLCLETNVSSVCSATQQQPRLNCYVKVFLFILKWLPLTWILHRIVAEGATRWVKAPCELLLFKS